MPRPAPTVLVTGGAGFIGSALVRHLMGDDLTPKVVVVDCLTYAGNLDNLAGVSGDPRYVFSKTDIRDKAALDEVFSEHKPDYVIHLAAESHVDRSIDGPQAFVETNINGTYNLLEAARLFWMGLGDEAQAAFRFLHVSTDEVFGSLGEDGCFDETTPYAPTSPYSASKAASDHLVRAWGQTYGLPILVSNCSNNYGPYQFPEKLIPLMILNALEGKLLPVYGAGANVRDWLYVDDHATALWEIARRGRRGETYCIGGRAERTNLQIVETICALLDERLPESPYRPHANLITFVEDRPGHDVRYAIDDNKLSRDLGLEPSVTFEDGLAKTIDWYLSNGSWCQRCLDGSYRRERLGLGAMGG